MRVARICLMMSFPAVLVSDVPAQQRPDFSGLWAYSADRSTGVPAKNPRTNFGNRFVVKQAADKLTVERSSAQSTVVEEYALDGSETRLTRPNGFESVSTTSWEGSKLVISTKARQPGEGGAIVNSESRRVLSLEPPDLLVVETTIIAPRPLEGWVSIYKKTTPEALAASLQVTPAKAVIADVAWIAGAWTGGGGPVAVEERWTPPAGGAMLGVSRTVKESRMVAFEFLRIVERGGTLLYIAQPNGRPPTEFTLTAFDAQSATFENPAHDFPKKIRYAKRADGGLEATISGDGGGKPETFVFKRGS